MVIGSHHQGSPRQVVIDPSTQRAVVPFVRVPFVPVEDVGLHSQDHVVGHGSVGPVCKLQRR